MKQKTGDKATLGWIVAVAKGSKRYVLALTLVQMVLGVSSMGYALFMGELVNGAVAGDGKRFLTYAGALVGLVVAQFVLRTLLRFLDEYAKSTLENGYKRRLFDCLLRRDYAAVTATHSGEWLNRMTSDTVVVANAVTHIIPGVCGTLVRMIAALVLLLTIAPDLGLVIVIGAPVVIGLTLVFRKLLKQLHLKVQLADGAFRVFMTERLSSLMILRAFGQEDAALSQGDRRMAEHKAARMKKNRIASTFHNGFAVVMNCMYVLGAVYCGYGILRGTMAYGDFTTVLQLVSQTNGPIANISGYFPQYSAMLASAERLMEIEAFRQEEAVLD